MTLEELFYGHNPWLFLFATLAVFLCVFAAGYRLGKRAKDNIDETLAMNFEQEPDNARQQQEQQREMNRP